MSNKLTIQAKDLLALGIAACFIPILDESLSYLAVRAVPVLAFLTALFFLLKARSLSQNAKILAASVMFFAVLIGFYYVMKISSSPLQAMFYEITWIVVVLNSLFLFVVFSERQRKLLFFAIIIISLVTLTKMYITGRDLILTEQFKDALLFSSNTYATAIVAFSGVCLILLLKGRRLIDKLICAYGIYLSFYIVAIVLQRGINTLLLLAMLFLILFYNKIRKRYSVLVAVIVPLAIGLLIWSGTLQRLLLGLCTLIPSERLVKRLTSVVNALNSGDFMLLDHSFIGRMRLVGVSIGSWTNSIVHFFFGNGEHVNTNTVIGNHSTVFDAFARYGLLGGATVLLCFYRIALPYIKNTMTENYALKRQCMVLLIGIFVRGLIGDILTGYTAIYMLYFLPLAVERVNAAGRSRAPAAELRADAPYNQLNP